MDEKTEKFNPQQIKCWKKNWEKKSIILKDLK
jgi:hypothetical protein